MDPNYLNNDEVLYELHVRKQDTITQSIGRRKSLLQHLIDEEKSGVRLVSNLEHLDNPTTELGICREKIDSLTDLLEVGIKEFDENKINRAQSRIFHVVNRLENLIIVSPNLKGSVEVLKGRVQSLIGRIEEFEFTRIEQDIRNDDNLTNIIDTENPILDIGVEEGAHAVEQPQYVVTTQKGAKPKTTAYGKFEQLPYSTCQYVTSVVSSLPRMSTSVQVSSNIPNPFHTKQSFPDPYLFNYPPPYIPSTFQNIYPKPNYMSKSNFEFVPRVNHDNYYQNPNLNNMKINNNNGINQNNSRENNISRTEYRQENNANPVPKWQIRFDGTNKSISIERFIFRIEKLAEAENYPINKLVYSIHHLLIGKAEKWYWIYLEKNDSENLTWTKLEADLKAEFEEQETDLEIRHVIESRKQRVKEKFGDFRLEIEELNLRLKNKMSENELLLRLQANMLPELREKLLILKVDNVSELDKICRKFEKLWSEIGEPIFNSSRVYRPRPNIYEVNSCGVDSPLNINNNFVDPGEAEISMIQHISSHEP